MGYMRHHAIVVTSWDIELLREAHKKAKELNEDTTEITPEATNGYRSFLFPPDGSKEGWDESDDGDDRRNEFIIWLGEHRYDDGSTSLAWVEVQFGDEERETIVTRHSDEEAYYAGKDE